MAGDDGTVVTRELLERRLRALGLHGGMYLEVHSSLSSFGRVEGGALTVIEALQALVGRDGAIIMPAFPLTKPLTLDALDRSRGLTLKLRILDPDSREPTGMGVIADTFRRLPGVSTGSGLFRVAAWGAEAARNAEGLANLHARDGHCLLLGVDIHALTSMHYVEDKLPEEVRSIFRPAPEVRRHYPEDAWFIETGQPPEQAWYKIQEQAFRRGLIRETTIGRARCLLFKVNDVIGLYREALERDALGLYGLRQPEAALPT